MRLMGLDVGDKTVGVAVSDELGLTAQGVTTVERRSWAHDLAELKAIAEEYEVQKLVVGLPLNMDGSEGPRAQTSRAFAERASAALGIPFDLWDERLSTAEVQRLLISADVSRKKRKQVVDKLAAQVILQGYLDSRPAREKDAPS
ncbi:MAG: Holliday junction resolvase RuvX [Deltaproteobacteria bacterium]|nr:Holliday junction resolvase RuvX [Deltaproteobacteria bacterium]